MPQWDNGPTSSDDCQPVRQKTSNGYYTVYCRDIKLFIKIIIKISVLYSLSDCYLASADRLWKK